jgi:hypothetical protein
MPMTIKFVEPKALSTARVRGKLLATVVKYGRLIEKDFQSITATWFHEVRVIKYLSFAGGNVSVNVFTQDKIFDYLDRGTSTRHAVMTRDFQPKTRQGYIGSFPGSGHKAFVSTSIDMGGIAARNWTIAIKLKHEDNFGKDVEKAVFEGLQT